MFEIWEEQFKKFMKNIKVTEYEQICVENLFKIGELYTNKFE